MYVNSLINKFPKIIPIGIPNKFFSCSGSQNFLRNLAGITLGNKKLKKTLNKNYYVFKK